MKPIEIVESKIWFNRITGRTASIYGAVPWSTQAQKAEWSLETRGYALRFDNGTVGHGARPFKTRKEAELCMSHWQ